MTTKGLTQAQRAVLPEWRGKWIAAVRKTAAIDREHTADAIKYLYAKHGLFPPRFFWMQSPSSAVLTIGFIYTIARMFGEAHEPGPRYTSRFDAKTLSGVFCDRYTYFFQDICKKQFGNQIPKELHTNCNSVFDPWPRTTSYNSCRRKFCNLGAYVYWNSLEQDGRMRFLPPLNDMSLDIRRELRTGLGSPVSVEEGCKAVWNAVGNWRYSGGFPWINFWKSIWDQAQTSWHPLKSFLSKGTTIDAIINAVSRIFASANDDWDNEPWLGRMSSLCSEVAVQTFCRDVIRMDLMAPQLKDLGVAEELIRSCGWWWPFPGFCVISERPSELHLDQVGRLHHNSDAALRFSDGFGVYMWHGTQIPQSWINEPDKVSGVEVLTTKNIEERRAGLEIFGCERVFRSAGARTIDKNENPQIGELLEVMTPHAGEERLRFLKVLCGTGREFVLQVPPDLPTALAANAWTYRLEGNEYQLDVRT